jgi:hypothetical protein
MNHKKGAICDMGGGSECTNVPVDWRRRLAGIQEHYGKSQDRKRTKVRINTDRNTWKFRAENGTGSVETDDDRHHHAHTSARTATSYPLSLPPTAILPCAPQLHCYTATATPNPNTAYTALCHCLSRSITTARPAVLEKQG